MNIIQVRLYFLLITILWIVSSTWVQERKDSHHSNRQIDYFGDTNWEYYLDETISGMDIQQIIVSGDIFFWRQKLRRYGMCFYYHNRMTGKQLYHECYKSSQIDGPVIFNQHSIIAAASFDKNGDWRNEVGFIFNETNVMKRLNHTGVFNEIYDLGNSITLLKNWNDRYEKAGTIMSVDIQSELINWVCPIQTAFGIFVMDSDKMYYFLDIERKYITVINAQTGEVTLKIKYSYHDNKDVSIRNTLVANSGPKNLYFVQEFWDANRNQIEAYSIEQKSSLWKLDITSMYSDKPVLDNAGNYLIINMAGDDQVWVVNTSSGKIDYIIKEENWTHFGIIGITNKNYIVLYSNKGIDVRSIPEGILIQSFRIKNVPTCVLDENSLYCCTTTDTGKPQCIKKVLE